MNTINFMTIIFCIVSLHFVIKYYKLHNKDNIFNIINSNQSDSQYNTSHKYNSKQYGSHKYNSKQYMNNIYNNDNIYENDNINGSSNNIYDSSNINGSSNDKINSSSNINGSNDKINGSSNNNINSNLQLESIETFNLDSETIDTKIKKKKKKQIFIKNLETELLSEFSNISTQTSPDSSTTTATILPLDKSSNLEQIFDNSAIRF